MNSRQLFKAAVLLTSIALPVAAGSITTTFLDNNGFSGNMFDVTIGANSLTVNSLDVNVSAVALTVDVYIKSGTYVGFDTTPAAWTLVSATPVTGSGAGNPTLVNVTPFALSAGQTYGVYVTLSTTANTMYYTDGSNTYSNSDLSLAAGEGLGGLFGANAVFPGRTWDGTINYTLASTLVPEPASLGLLTLVLGPGLWFARRRYLRK